MALVLTDNPAIRAGIPRRELVFMGSINGVLREGVNGGDTQRGSVLDVVIPRLSCLAFEGSNRRLAQRTPTVNLHPTFDTMQTDWPPSIKRERPDNGSGLFTHGTENATPTTLTS